MFNFFVNEDKKQDGFYLIDGADNNHIRNVLRMKAGDELLVSCNGKSDLCEIEGYEADAVIVKILTEGFQDTALSVKISLFQGIPKGDKMELIIQKAVELGVDEVIPVEMNRCVVKLDEKKKKSKTERWQAIAEGAAKQSKRTSVPRISCPVSYNEALKTAQKLNLILLPYESKNGMEATKDALKKLEKGMSVGIFIGPEGGFDEKEVASASEQGAEIISLGKRILRTETAAITASAMVMLYAEMMID